MFSSNHLLGFKNAAWAVLQTKHTSSSHTVLSDNIVFVYYYSSCLSCVMMTVSLGVRIWVALLANYSPRFPPVQTAFLPDFASWAALNRLNYLLSKGKETPNHAQIIALTHLILAQFCMQLTTTLHKSFSKPLFSYIALGIRFRSFQVLLLSKVHSLNQIFTACISHPSPLIDNGASIISRILT